MESIFKGLSGVEAPRAYEEVIEEGGQACTSSMVAETQESLIEENTRLREENNRLREENNRIKAELVKESQFKIERNSLLEENSKLVNSNQELNKLLKESKTVTAVDIETKAENSQLRSEVDRLRGKLESTDNVNKVDNRVKYNADMEIIKSLMVEGKTPTEIAKILGISRQTVWRKIKQIREDMVDVG